MHHMYVHHMDTQVRVVALDIHKNFALECYYRTWIPVLALPLLTFHIGNHDIIMSKIRWSRCYDRWNLWLLLQLLLLRWIDLSNGSGKIIGGKGTFGSENCWALLSHVKLVDFSCFSFGWMYAWLLSLILVSWWAKMPAYK